jgi:putative restriction endonuclease
VQERFVLEAPAADQQYRAEARTVTFRRIVVEAYGHTCVLRGVRLIAPEGRTAVVAAHIVPRRVTHNDDPGNGLALCGLHHWSFDQGLITVAADHVIKVSPVVIEEEGSLTLRRLAGQEARRAVDSHMGPAPAALAWHAEYVFRPRAQPRLIQPPTS